MPPTTRTTLTDTDRALSKQLQHALAARGIVRRLAIVAARSADFWICAPVLVGIWWLAAPSIGRLALDLLLGVTVTGIAVRGVKQTARRARPHSDWGGSYRRYDPHSFPSGHAARVGTIAAFGALVFPAWAGGALALWAVAVAIARVGLGVHYVSDVVAGLVLGVALGGLTVALL